MPVVRVQGTPGSRLNGAVHVPVWRELGLRVLKADRPGFGHSTRLAGRGIADVADDLVQLLDHLGLDRVPIAGASGGGPHVLALCALHPDRISATVVVGAAPLDESDLPQMAPVNAEAWRRAQRDDWAGILALVEELRRGLLADPLTGFRRVMEQAPPEDQQILNDPRWQEGFVVDVREALRQGGEGWADETYAVWRPWDFPVEAVGVPVMWWHGRDDASAPLSAVQRLVAQVPTINLRLWDGAGHLEAFRREREIFRDLVSRATQAS